MLRKTTDLEISVYKINTSIKAFYCGLLTEVDDGNSGSILSDGKFIDDGLDEVNDELPVVASDRVIVTYTTRVVNHERNVSNTRCNDNKIIRPIYFVSTA